MIDLPKLTNDELGDIVSWLEDERCTGLFLKNLAVTQDRLVDKLISGCKDQREEDELRGRIKAIAEFFKVHDNCVLQMREIAKNQEREKSS